MRDLLVLSICLTFYLRNVISLTFIDDFPFILLRELVKDKLKF